MHKEELLKLTHYLKHIIEYFNEWYPCININNLILVKFCTIFQSKLIIIFSHYIDFLYHSAISNIQLDLFKIAQFHSSLS
jgi:hypothetical protein